MEVIVHSNLYQIGLCGAKHSVARPKDLRGMSAEPYKSGWLSSGGFHVEAYPLNCYVPCPLFGFVFIVVALFPNSDKLGVLHG